MTYNEDWNEPYITAADTMGAARIAASMLRRELPVLLGNRFAPTLSMIADRFERGHVLDPFCRDALAAVLAECDLVIERGTRRQWVLDETGLGPDGLIYTPDLRLFRSREAEELLRIRQLLQTVQDRAYRTLDLIAGEAAVREIRT